MKLNRRYILLVIMVAAVVTLFLPIKVHYSFEATARVYPLKEWFLKRGQEDSYITEMHNYANNTLSHLKSYKFERGDISEVLLDTSLMSGEPVRAGDTVAYINSFLIENEIIRLESARTVEEGNLSVSLVGEKQAMIDQAQQEYNFARGQLELEEKNYKRNLKLYQDSIISTAEFDIHENAYKLASINVEIAYNELIAAQTGVRQEEVNVIRQKIESYDREIRNLEELKGQYYVIAPIDGIVSFNQVVDGILMVSDTSKYILKIPVRVNNIQYIDRISAIRFSIPGYDEKVGASFLDLDDNVSLFADEQLVMAKALIDGGQFRVYPGMAVQCNVYCDQITLLGFLRRSIQLHI